MKNKKVLIGVIIAVVVIVIAVVAAVIIIGNKEQEEAKNLLNDYFSLINNKSYDEMYEKTASMNTSKDDFVTRNKNIYEGIDASDIQIEINNVEKADGGYNVSYHEKMYTSAGDVDFDNTANVVKECTCTKKKEKNLARKIDFIQKGRKQKLGMQRSTG